MPDKQVPRVTHSAQLLHQLWEPTAVTSLKSAVFQRLYFLIQYPPTNPASYLRRLGCCVLYTMYVQSMSVLSALCRLLEERLQYVKDADYLRMDGSVSVLPGWLAGSTVLYCIVLR